MGTLLKQVLLALISPPVPGATPAERARNLQQTRRLRAQTGRVSPRFALGMLLREAFYALIGQPSPEARSPASRRRPRP